MNRLRGFTLVELLVVIAIISILAAIVVPNVARYIERARMTRALSEIKSIELALTKILADSDRGSLFDLFNPEGVRDIIGQGSPYLSSDQWAAAQQIYTRTVYALLRDGRAIVQANPDTITIGSTPVTLDYNLVVNRAALQKLGTSYLDIGFDPWGNLYNIFPGPWSTRNGPSVFRTFLAQEGNDGQNLPGRGVRTDTLTLNGYIDPETDEPLQVSFPAARDKVAFIWSAGANLLSGQAIYAAPGTVGGDNPYTGTDTDYPSQEPEFIGGGDDVNNWDSNRSWERFYN